MSTANHHVSRNAVLISTESCYAETDRKLWNFTRKTEGRIVTNSFPKSMATACVYLWYWRFRWTTPCWRKRNRALTQHPLYLIRVFLLLGLHVHLNRRNKPYNVLCLSYYLTTICQQHFIFNWTQRSNRKYFSCNFANNETKLYSRTNA